MEESVKFSRRKFLELLGIATASAGLVSMTGCGSSSSSSSSGSSSSASASLVYGQNAEPRALDPAFFDDGESAKIACNIYEGLYAYGEKDTTVKACLASDLPVISSDGMTYTIKLRQGVKFHDGTEFKADAVIKNITRQLPPNATSDMPYASFVYGDGGESGTGVKSVTKIDDYTVEIAMYAPSTPFLKNLAMALAAPIPSPTALDANKGNVSTAPCGTGPYKFVSWTRDDNVKLEAFDGYWDTANAPKVKNVIFKFIKENSTRVTSLLNGECDIIDGIDVSVVDQITNAKYTLFAEDGMTINYLAFNTESGKCTDVEVRKAVCQAINVEEMVKALYGDYAGVANAVMPTWMAPYNADIKQADYDPSAAKATLAAKGITKLSCITYSAVRPYNSKGGEELAKVIQGYLQAVGVTLDITPYDWTAYKTKVQTDSYDFCFYGWTGDNGDPDNFMNLLADSNWSQNVARFNDAEYKALIAKGLATPDGDARDAIYKQCEQMVADKHPWLPISHSKNLCGVSPKVGNFFYHPTGVVFMKNFTKK